MKKFLALAVICCAMAQAKMFVGVDGGFTFDGSASNGKTNASIYNSNDGRFDSHGWDVDIVFGAESFAGDYFGARAFLDLGYFSGLNHNRNSIDITGNADVMINFLKSGSFTWGVFGGLGIGYKYSFAYGNFDNGQGYAPFFGRTGMSFGIGGNSRIDLTVRLPIMGWKVHGNNGSGVYAPLDFQVGYKFLF